MATRTNGKSIDENFLHYLWRIRQIDISDLRLVSGEAIKMLEWGRYNSNAGPDFLHGRIQINRTQWSGHIEHHIKSSDWFAHGHHKDPAYDNVVLHVVYEHDKEVHRRDGSQIPCLLIRDRIDIRLFERYESFFRRLDDIPCKHQISVVKEVTWRSWLDALLVERLMQKTERLGEKIASNKLDWESLLYETLAHYLGGVNGESMVRLAEKTPLKHLLKERHDPLNVQALLFGQSGLPQSAPTSVYARNLLERYVVLKSKYNLTPMRSREWKFSRMRPDNFPTIRIAQLAEVYSRHGMLFRQIIETADWQTISRWLRDISAGEFWKNHYHFAKSSKKRVKKLGKERINIILINAIIPTLYAYGQMTDKHILMERALSWLGDIPSENNRVVRKWMNLERDCKSAAASQAYLQLYKHYCLQRKCLQCRIGHAMLNHNRSGNE